MQENYGQAGFNRLPASQKMELLNKQGNLLSARVKRGFVVMLYRVDNFFVELWRQYDGGVKDIKAVFSFSSSSGLNPYKALRKS